MLANIRKALLEIRNQLFALAGNVNRLTPAAFRANPVREFLGRGMHESALAGHRRWGPPPLVQPELLRDGRLVEVMPIGTSASSICGWSFAKILSGVNAFEISNLQEQETESRYPAIQM